MNLYLFEIAAKIARPLTRNLMEHLAGRGDLWAAVLPRLDLVGEVAIEPTRVPGTLTNLERHVIESGCCGMLWQTIEPDCLSFGQLADVRSQL